MNEISRDIIPNKSLVDEKIVWHDHHSAIVEYYKANDSKTELKTLLWSAMRYVNMRNGKFPDHNGRVDFLAATLEEVDVNQTTIK